MASHNKPFTPSISWFMNLMEQLYFTFRFWSVRIPPLDSEKEHNAYLVRLKHLVVAYFFLEMFLEDWFTLFPSECCGPAFHKRFLRIKCFAQNLYEKFRNLELKFKGVFD